MIPQAHCCPMCKRPLEAPADITFVGDRTYYKGELVLWGYNSPRNRVPGGLTARLFKLLYEAGIGRAVTYETLTHQLWPDAARPTAKSFAVQASRVRFTLHRYRIPLYIRSERAHSLMLVAR